MLTPRAKMIMLLLLLQVTGLFSADPTCPDGFTVLNDDTCVKFVQTPLFYQDALNYCKQFTGGHLVSVSNAIDNRKLFNMAQGYSHPMWLGLTCRESIYGTCEWEDESGYTDDYNFFAMGSPNVDVGNNVYMLPSGSSQGRWASADGTISQFAFFCEVPTNGAPVFCPSERDGYCYTMKLIPLNEADARAYCQKTCGDLASIHSSDENKYITNLYPYTTLWYQYRIGARAAADGFNNYWIDRSPFDYSNFQFFNTQAGVCTSVSTMNVAINWEKWISNPCDQLTPFACKRAKNATSCGPRSTGDPSEPTFKPVTYAPTPMPTVVDNKPANCYHAHFFSGSGSIYSPFYPGTYYPVLAPCYYIITVPRGTIAQIQFTPDTYIKKSTILLYSYVEDGDQFGNFTGYPSPYPYNSTTNVIKLVFTIFSDHDGPELKWGANFGNNETLPNV